MSEDERIAWSKEWRAAREAALEYWHYHVIENEQMDRSSASYEYADGHECVIYTHKARTLFDDSSEVREHEDDPYHDPEASIDDRITHCVFLALQWAFDDALDELEALDIPDEDELDDETLEAWAWRAGREALGMETKA